MTLKEKTKTMKTRKERRYTPRTKSAKKAVKKDKKSPAKTKKDEFLPIDGFPAYEINAARTIVRNVSKKNIISVKNGIIKLINPEGGEGFIEVPFDDIKAIEAGYRAPLTQADKDKVANRKKPGKKAVATEVTTEPEVEAEEKPAKKEKPVKNKPTPNGTEEIRFKKGDKVRYSVKKEEFTGEVRIGRYHHGRALIEIFPADYKPEQGRKGIIYRFQEKLQAA